MASKVRANAILRLVLLGFAAIGPMATRLPAEGTPAGAHESAADTPSVRLGGVIFADYTYLQAPDAVDTDGHKIQASAFNITRAYINAFATLSRLVSARITTDITSDTNSADTSLNGSTVVRLKFAFGQINFDQWVGPGAWFRIGLQQTPWLDYNETIYRYRFQGQLLENQEGYVTASDFGATAHYNFPSNYGDVHLGWYNGEGYTSLADNQGRNNQKGFQIRGSVRPAPTSDVLKGLRVALFYDGDNYVHDATKQRFFADLTFEHPYINFSAEYIQAKDQNASASKAEVTSEGYSIWATPRTPIGLEALLRYDSLKPNKNVNARKTRFIGGVSYWFPVQKGVSSALMIDYTSVKYDTALGKPDSKAWALHSLFQF